MAKGIGPGALVAISIAFVAIGGMMGAGKRKSSKGKVIANNTEYSTAGFLKKGERYVIRAKTTLDKTPQEVGDMLRVYDGIEGVEVSELNPNNSYDVLIAIKPIMSIQLATNYRLQGVPLYDISVEPAT